MKIVRIAGLLTLALGMIGVSACSNKNENQEEQKVDTGNNTGGNTGGDTGNTGGDTGNTGGDTGNTGGNTGSTDNENKTEVGDILTYAAGLNESIALEWDDASFKEDSTEVSYKLEGDTEYTKIDDELVRTVDSKVRADILGLKAGKYSIKVENDSKYMVRENIVVSAQDRSGYAHFNTTQSVGAYNNDGTVKDGAVIVYVDDTNKNTVKATINGKTYTGLSEIMSAQKDNPDNDVDTPVIIRVLGRIATPTWNSKTLAETESLLAKLGKEKINEEDIISNGINTLNYTGPNGETLTKLEGLDNRAKYKAGDCDSVFNTMNIEYTKNMTVEGVGTDAEFFQWGMTWKKCSYIEVKNITFDDYPEDACSFEGSEPENCTTIAGFKTGHIWIHNNTFNQGKNYWDLTAEQDKYNGDGATDFKGNAYITVAYNHYYSAHKTGLVGGGDSQTTACLTFHHNYYQQNGSRLPLGRRANMHMYNNYYYGSTGNNMSLRNGAYAFIEGCYFQNISKTFELKGGSVIKGFNNTLVSCSNTSGMTTVSSRTEAVSNSNIYGQDFDTNSSIFYYDSTNKVSNVSYLSNAETAKEDCLTYSGVLKKNANAYPIGNGSITTPSEPETPEVEEDTTNWNTLYENDFSTSQTFGTTAITNEFFYESYVASDKTASGGINNISIVDGKLFVQDTDTGASTNAYLKFNSITSGKVKISMDVLFEGTFPNKWTFIQFINASGSEFLGVRSTETGTIGYRIDGGTITGSAVISDSTAFNIELILDMDKKEATLEINGTNYTIDLSTSSKLDNISGIKLFTATGSRSFYIDNMLIQTA